MSPEERADKLMDDLGLWNSGDIPDKYNYSQIILQAISDGIRAAVAEERERCAKVIEDAAKCERPGWAAWLHQFSSAIRTGLDWDEAQNSVSD